MTHGPIEIELNPRERRMYDRVRAALRAPRPGGQSSAGDVLLLLPDLAVLLFRLLRDPRVAWGDKALVVLGLGYVLSPVDLLPEFLFGPFGLLDDVLVVAATLSRLMNHVHPDVVRSHWSGKGDALEAVHRVTEWSERQIGGRLRTALRGLIGR
jgi:uncharacterized membrane protein YkvA (DUF1232 family)